MIIKVRQDFEFPSLIPCKHDGLCLHNGDTESELIEDYDGCTSWEQFCVGCGAQWNDMENEWMRKR